MADVKSILQELKKSKKNLNVFSFTMKDKIDIAAINLAQQSKIIETVTGASQSSNNPILTVLEFNNVMFSILKKNIVDYQPIFSTLDRTNFILALKGQIDKIVTTDDNIDFDIEQMLQRNESMAIELEPETITVDSITFTVAPPTMDEDNLVNNLILRKYKASAVTKTLLSDVYNYEALKFIKTIAIGDQVIELKKDSKSLDVIKEISAADLKPVYAYIAKTRSLEEALTRHMSSDEQLDLTPDLFIT